MRDHRGRFIILCPETSLKDAILLGRRVSHAIMERTSHNVLLGTAAFPEEALTFDDLLMKARERLSRYVEVYFPMSEGDWFSKNSWGRISSAESSV